MFQLIRGCHLIEIFKSFRCIIYLFNILFQMVFSLQWALTHRSFPRILPDSSNFLGAIPKFLSKFVVRMNFHQLDAFPRSISNHFIVGSTSSLFILPEYLSNFGGVFPSSFEDRRRVFPLNLVRSSRDSWF